VFDRRDYLISDLHEAKFDLGFFDTWDTGALFIFHEAGIKNVFGINNTQLNAYQFKYAGKDFPINVPGFIQYMTKYLFGNFRNLFGTNRR